MEAFSQCVSNLFLLLQDDNSEILAANVILPLLERLANAAADAEAVAETPSHRSAVNEMHCHGLQRVAELLLQQCQELFQSTDTKDDEVQQDETQRLSAQSTELTLQILHILEAVQRRTDKPSSTVAESANKLIQDYGDFQKETLRTRCKPAIATLVKERRKGTFRKENGSSSSPLDGNGLVIATEDEEEEQDHQYHAAAVASILQHSIRLVHPLLVWLSGIQAEGSPMGASIFSLCETANATLFQQTQEFIHTVVGEWFFDDLQIKEQMESMNTQNAETTLVDAHFDASVSELASICHMLSDFSVSAARQSAYPSQWTEWKLHCGVLQRHWLLSHYHAVRQKAVPMTVVTDTDVRSSSLVEDAALLSTVALEKSVDVAGIANNLCQSIWGLEDEASVYSALCQRVGCLGRMMPTTASSPSAAASSRPDSTKSPPKSGNFAVALLEAMDGETDDAPHAPPTTFLSNLLEQDAVRLYEFDTNCCLWNSFFAASKAIQSIRDTLPEDDDGSMDHQTSSMLELVRDEMTSFATRYNQELEANIHAAVVSDSGWEKLGSFLKSENYLLQSEAELATAESEERLDRDFLSPLRKSMLLEQTPKKCDDGVQTIVWKEMMAEASRLLISTIENMAPNSMTDWGALLFSQQARLLHGAIPSDSVVPEDDTLPQILAVLQLERPADWLAYCSTSCLDAKRVRQTMAVRAGFTDVVIDSIIASAYGDDSGS